MVGPASAAEAAKAVQYACWKYAGQLEDNPYQYDQRLIDKVLHDFIGEAQVALGIDSSLPTNQGYREWVKSLPSDNDE